MADRTFADTHAYISGLQRACADCHAIADKAERLSLPVPYCSITEDLAIGLSFVSSGRRATFEIYADGEIIASTYSTTRADPDVLEFRDTGAELEAALDKIKAWLAGEAHGH